MAKKAKNKKEELDARKAIDNKNVLGKYDELLECCKAARDFLGGAYAQKCIKVRMTAVNNSYKEFIKATQITPDKIETKEDLKPLTKPLKDLKDAVDRLDEFTFDARRDVLALQAHMNKHDDAPLLCKEMKQAASWNGKKGIVEIKKIK